MSYATAIGPYATAMGDGEFAVTCRAPGEQILIKPDGSAAWPGDISLRDAARGAAATLVAALWTNGVPEASRALVLARLYGRMGSDARVESLKSAPTARTVLVFFDRHADEFLGEPSPEAVSASILLADLLSRMTLEGRHEALEALIVTGLDLSRKTKKRCRRMLPTEVECNEALPCPHHGMEFAEP